MRVSGGGFRTTSVVAALTVALALTGCSGGAGDASAPANAVIAEVQALTPENLDAKANEISQNDYRMLRSLMAAGGLDEELGGAARGDAALRAMMVEFRRQMLGARAEIPRLVKAADIGGAPGLAGLGASFFAGLLTTGPVVAMSTQGDVEGREIGTSKNDGSFQASFDASSVTTSSTFDGEVSGMKGRIRTQVRVDTCPSANGTITADFESDSALTRVGGTASANLKVTAKAQWRVNDDAEFSNEMELEVRVQNAAFGGARGSNGAFVDYSKILSSINASSNGSKVNRTSSKASKDDVAMAAAAADMAQLAVLAIASTAKEAFQSGKCVKLEPTTQPAKRTGAKPKTSFAILAAPRSKLDGTPTGGSVKATLDGAGSLDPAGTKVPADAKFTYVAGEANTKGTVAFEARSKRGIGKATLVFDTMNRGYKAVGGGGDWSGSGVICSLTEPFTISGQGLTTSYTPSSETGGSYTLSGAYQGKWRSSGSGSYTVSVDDSGGTLKANGTGRVTMMGRALRSYPHSATFKLTPTDECP